MNSPLLVFALGCLQAPPVAAAALPLQQALHNKVTFFPTLFPPCALPRVACRRRLLQLLRFHSSKSPDKLTSLSEYVGRMKEGQKHIYYLVGEHSDVARVHMM